MQISAYRVTARRSAQTFECLITPIRDDRSDEEEKERRRFSRCWTLMGTTTRWHRRRWRRERWCGGGRMLGGCCTRPKGSTRMGHGTSPKGRVSTHSCRLPLCYPVCPTVHTYQHARTHSGDAITGNPPSFFLSALSPSFPRVYVFPLSLSLSPSLLVLYFASRSIFLPYFSSFSSVLFVFLSLFFCYFSLRRLHFRVNFLPLNPPFIPLLKFPLSFSRNNDYTHTRSTIEGNLSVETKRIEHTKQ